MDLLSAFKRKPRPEPPAGPDSADEVQRARTRARQRLIGAAVLVVAGIIGFPLLFETQPRPVPVDLPIDIPRKDAVPPLALPASAASMTPNAAPRASAPAAERVITETREEAGRELPAALPASAPTAAAPLRPASAASGPAAAPPAARAAAPVPGSADAARAQALLEGRSPAAPAASAAAGGARYVVQVGAFADAAGVRELRAKVEKLGLATYTQVAETPAGPRTRVRVGPFASRDEAERAAAKLKAASLPGAILTL